MTSKHSSIREDALRAVEVLLLPAPMLRHTERSFGAHPDPRHRYHADAGRTNASGTRRVPPYPAAARACRLRSLDLIWRCLPLIDFRSIPIGGATVSPRR